MAHFAESAFPVGCFVRAFRDGEMWAGIVTAHSPEEAYLVVRFSNGQSERFAYMEINDTDDSMVIYRYSGGGLKENLPRPLSPEEERNSDTW